LPIHSTLTRRAVLALGAAAALPALAQGFPDKPVTLVNPYPAGTAADVTARQFANEFAKVLKQPVVVVNKGGAGGLIGTKFSATAPPDGYTVGIGAIGTHVFNPAINPATNYDPVKDFVPVSRFVSFPNVLVVPSSLGVNTVADLVALGKSRGATKPLIYGTGGNGTTSHISAAQLSQLSGIKVTAVNYQGTSSAVNELLGGRLDFVMANINLVLQHIRAGTLKPLAIASDKRYKLLPSTPTFNEIGMPEMEMVVWTGLFLPAGTPHQIAITLNDAVKKVAHGGVLQPVYEAAGATVEFDNSPEDFARFLQADIKKWVPVVKAMGIQAQ
jgi:tripartite-type tricarboxylate transporter receptor subunit TctC